jgi:hypothetical protein
MIELWKPAWGEFDDDPTYSARDGCVEAILRDSQANCFYCQFDELYPGDEDW